MAKDDVIEVDGKVIEALPITNSVCDNIIEN